MEVVLWVLGKEPCGVMGFQLRECPHAEQAAYCKLNIAPYFNKVSGDVVNLWRKNYRDPRMGFMMSLSGAVWRWLRMAFELGDGGFSAAAQAQGSRRCEAVGGLFIFPGVFTEFGLDLPPKGGRKT